MVFSVAWLILDKKLGRCLLWIAPAVVGCWAKGRGFWGASVQASCWVKFGLEWWSEEKGISGRWVVGFCWNSRWFGGDYWVELGEKWRVEVVEFWVRLGDEFGEILKVFWGLNC